MSGCMDVCVYHDADGYSEFGAVKTVTARKAHKCSECNRLIAPRTRYERASGKYEGDFYSDATCLVCVEIRKAFVCGSWVFGMLWESIEEELFWRWRTEGPFECLAKLDTEAARDYCRQRYAEWEADHAA